MTVDNGLTFDDSNKGVIVIKQEDLNYYTDTFEPGQTKQKLRIGREVEGGVGGKYYASNSSKNPGIGQQTITGVGFKPKLIIIHGISVGTHCYGQYSAGNNSSYCHTIEGSTTNYYTGRFLRVNSGASSSRANLLSVNDDGFILDWTTCDLITQFMFQCYG